ncbi:NUMOD3 domain-containing DNA-binding protein [Microbacterium sp. CJ88]|uniref:NUMOD3 domain-containing DNA-binding protein n=1 Tax=Microbacterium sp. CJ88 TaxID=3445672 RepID=UPI003F655FCE
MGLIYGVRQLGSPEYRYVGLTTKTVTRRKSEHFKVADGGRKTAFADWLRTRDGREDAYFHSLELVMSEDLADLGAAEERWIEKLRAEGHRLLNLNDGGLGNHGYVWTDEQRAAASARHRGRKRENLPTGPDHPSWGTKRSAETRARMSEQRKGMNSGAANPNFGKFGQDHPAFGRRLSDETKARLSEQRRGERNPNFGRVMSDEDKKKRSDALKGRPMPSSRRSAHTRHHTNKNVYKETCTHCLDDRRSQANEGTTND